MSFEQFIQKWASPHPEYAPTRIAQVDFDRVEQKFGCILPSGYKQAILKHGIPRITIHLLHSVVEQGLDMKDVSEFFEPDEIISTSEGYWSAGMPSHLIAIASDCSGNVFCFDRRKAFWRREIRETIWFFDHDFVEVKLVAQNFESWIDAYNKIDPSPGALD